MKKITFLATALLMSLGSFAQQALFDNARCYLTRGERQPYRNIPLEGCLMPKRCRLLVISWHRKPLIHQWESMMLLE